MTRSSTPYLIGYGTLLLKASLGSTIGQSAASHREVMPVIVDGYIRTFNLRPDHYTPSHKFTDNGIESAAMNIEPSAGHSFNGFAFRTTVEELEALDQRECYYERIRVPIRDFDTGEALGEGSVYLGLDPWIQRDPKRLMPLWRDVVWGRTGAYRAGTRFGQYFDETTYLADNATLVVEVYRDLLEDISDVEFPE